MIDVHNERISRFYVQNIMKHVKIVKFSFIYNQLFLVWNDFDLKFRMQISKFKFHIEIFTFFELLNDKVNIWKNMIIFRRNANNVESVNADKINKSISKSNRERQNDFQQSFDANDFSFSYLWSSPDYNFYQYQNNVYNRSQKYQYSFSNEQNLNRSIFAVFVLSTSVFKQSLRIIFENAFDFKKSTNKSQTNIEKYNNRKNKTRTYVTNESKKKNMIFDNFQQKKNEYYFVNDDVNYYDSNHREFYEKNETSINFIVIRKFQFRCRRCKQIFSFNNILHNHFRVDCHSSKIKNVEIYFVNDFNFNFSTVDNLFIIDVTKDFDTTSSTNSTIIRFTIDFFTDVDIDYDFKNWNYVKTKTFLLSNVSSTNVCLDSDAKVSLIDRIFLKLQTFDLAIRIMTSSFKMRNLDIRRHETWKYAIVDVHLFELKNDKKIIFIFRRKLHLIDDLKINMLIDNDIMKSKQIVSNIVKKSIFVNTIDVILILKTRSFKNVIHRSVHLRKTTIVFSHSKMIVSVNHINFSISKNFLFESTNDLNIFMYVHVIDASTISIIVRNDKNVSIKISRNFRLKRMFEIDFSNVFHIFSNENVKHLIVKSIKFIHRNDWFKKLIFVCVIAYVVVATISFDVINLDVTIISVASIISLIMSFTSLIISTELKKSFVINFSSSKIVLFNEIIIYNFEIANFFVKIVKKFSLFWQNIDFAKLSKENWMRIFLKSDWKIKISEKIKIYSLKTKNRELMNRTFDEFHEFDKMNWTNQSIFFSYSVFVIWKTMNEKRKNKTIIDIKNLNAIIQFDAYSLSLQFDIIVFVKKCFYIFVIDCSTFFYQWRIHFSDRHKLTVVSHRDQKIFNVTIMNYKNSSAYVQRQINRLLKHMRPFVKTYVDDIVIFSKTKKKTSTSFTSNLWNTDRKQYFHQIN